MLATQDLIDFSVSAWYQRFKDSTIETVLFQINADLLPILRGSTDLESAEECVRIELDAIKAILMAFPDRECFAKTNWHAPTDSKFLSFNNSLKVTCVDDLLLFFNASHILSQDLAHERFSDYCIAFRPWVNIHPASEFRCIVINNVLYGITPRDWPTYYEHFIEDGQKIIDLITNFYRDRIKDKFSRQTYTFDVYINHPDDVILLDFGPINKSVELYAFNWKELDGIIKKGDNKEVAPVFRFVDKDTGLFCKNDVWQRLRQPF